MSGFRETSHLPRGKLGQKGMKTHGAGWCASTEERSREIATGLTQAFHVFFRHKPF